MFLTNGLILVLNVVKVLIGIMILLNRELDLMNVLSKKYLIVWFLMVLLPIRHVSIVERDII